nr:hypothetical protein [Tanacetum cinerariifolium]
MLPPSGDAIMDFLNQLRYTEVIYFVSRMTMNNLYQPWGAILSMINQCLTGKTSGHDRPGYPVLQMLWDKANLGSPTSRKDKPHVISPTIQTFLTDKVNLGSPTKKGRKDQLHVISYYRFTKLIICNLGRIHNNHQRSTSQFHLSKEDLRLVAIEKEGKMKTATAKKPMSKPTIEKSRKPAPAPKPKATKERPSKASTAKPSKPEPAKEKSTNITPPQQAGKGQIAKVCEGDEDDMKRAIQMSLESFQHVSGVAIREPVAVATQPLPVVEGKGKAIVTEEQAAHSLPSTQAQDDTSTNIVCDLPSPADAETGAASEKTNNGEDLISSTGTLSSMKNLEDPYDIRDQFINDKSTKDEPEKPNIEAEVVSMVTVPIYQASFTVAPLSTPILVIDLARPKPASSTTQAPIFRPEWLKPIPDDERPAIPEPAWVIPTSYIPDVVNKHRSSPVLDERVSQDAHSDWANPEGDQVRIDISKPLPLSGPPDHVPTQTHFFFNHDLDYLRYGSKGSGQALLISKMKVARYLDFALEYSYLSIYGSMRSAPMTSVPLMVVRTHMRKPSVVSIKAYSRYGYDYLKEITLCRADYQEYTIAEKDFKNWYPIDFEDLNMLLLQGHLNHLFGSDKRMLSTAVKLWKRNLLIRQQASSTSTTTQSLSPLEVVFPVGNNEWKIMRFNKIYRFSDGTLTNIMEALDYKVKEYKVTVCSSLQSLKPKRTIESRAKRSSINLIMTLFHVTCSSHNVKTKVTIRVLRIILVVKVKMKTEIPRSSRVYFITSCSYSIDTSNELMKVQVYASKIS